MWLDCDREGEHIAYEVLDVVKQHRPRIRPFRARFSSLIETDIERAIGHLGQLDPRLRDVRMAAVLIGAWVPPSHQRSSCVAGAAVPGCVSTQRN